MKIINRFLGYCCLLANPTLAQQTLEYHYDELGRLTYVTDSVNGNRDYDYDPAGNRINTATGFKRDEDSEFVKPPSFSLPAPPAFSLKKTEKHEPGVFQYTWDSVQGATHYEVDFSHESPGSVEVTLTSYGPTERPVTRVRARNAAGFSDWAYF